jgi:hypothetical protein
MPAITTTVTVPAPIGLIYRFLLERYDRPLHCSTALAAKGYIPNVLCLEADEPELLCFSVRGRDPLLRTFVGSWEWEYRLRPESEAVTEVAITYRWSWWVAFLCGGTARAQAANEIVETAMTLDALACGHAAARPAPSSEAIREADR